MTLIEVIPQVSGNRTASVYQTSRRILCWAAGMGLILLLGLTGCSVANRSRCTGPNWGGGPRLELCADELRLRRITLQVPALILLDCTGQNDPDEGQWRLTTHRPQGSPDLWQICLVQETDGVRRQIDYLVWRRQNAPVEPVMATEQAFDVDTGALLFQVQTVDWSIRDLDQGTEQAVDLARVAPWIRGHLDQIVSTDILDLCAEYLWHNSLEPGFAGVIACTNRRIELDPQVIEPYTVNAWLMWSAWVAWKLNPAQTPNGQGQADEAIRLVKKGRAANPHSAAYHLDAAETIAPLARHHLPALMDFVIQYYLYAEALTTDRDMLIRIRKGLGHRYREQNKIPEAIRWYRAVLALDPNNKVALRYLKKFEAEADPDALKQGEEDLTQRQILL